MKTVYTMGLTTAGALLACQPLNDLDAASRGAPIVASTEEPESQPSTSVAVPSSTSVMSEPGPAAPPTNASSVVGTSGATSAPSGETTSAGLVEDSQTREGVTVETSEVVTNENPVSPGFNEETSAGTSSFEDVTSYTTEGPGPTSEPTPNTCVNDCAMGDRCTMATQCLSMRCDQVCQPMELSVVSDGLDAISTSIKVHVELEADPSVPVAWRDLAVLYFVTVEKRDDFVLNYAEGGGTAMPMQVGLTDWIVVWTTDAAGNVPSTVTPFDVQFRSEPWLPDEAASNDNSNDYSYVKPKAPNDKIVLCHKVNDEWRQIQGTPPAAIPDPCQYVGNCDLVTCDPLE